MAYCCDRMERAATSTCEQHPDRRDCPDSLIERWQDGTTGLIIHDGGAAIMEIQYCPWCGTYISPPVPTSPEDSPR